MENERGSQAGAARLEAMEPLILASASPRRAEILRAVGWPFEANAADVDETRRAGEEPVAYILRLARAKAERIAATRLFGLVLGADTIVVSREGDVLGKPRDEEDARRMLRSLSDGWHEVLTGVVLVRAESKRRLAGVERTRVRFAALSEEEIDWYVSTGEQADKAGAYAIQGRAALFIKEIEGDYWNVVGLPIRLVYELARRFDREASADEA